MFAYVLLLDISHLIHDGRGVARCILCLNPTDCVPCTPFLLDCRPSIRCCQLDDDDEDISPESAGEGRSHDEGLSTNESVPDSRPVAEHDTGVQGHGGTACAEEVVADGKVSPTDQGDGAGGHQYEDVRETEDLEETYG